MAPLRHGVRELGRSGEVRIWVLFLVDCSRQGKSIICTSYHKSVDPSGPLMQSYRATVWINIAVLVLLFGPGISPVIRTALSVPSVVLQNAMACKVFRLLKLGLIEDDPTITISFKTSPDRTRNAVTYDTQGSSRSGDDIGLSTLPTTPTRYEGREIPLPLRAVVRRDVEIEIDDDGPARRDWKRVNLV